MAKRVTASCAMLALLAAMLEARAIPLLDRPFELIDESAVYDPASGEVRFRILFDRAPDFFTLDEQGRQAHSFQYFIFDDESLPYPEGFASIIRGEEIHITGDRLRVRNASPSASPDEPSSGGWGTMRGAVPFDLIGSVLTFSAPLGLVTNRAIEGSFEYALETYSFGTLTRVVDARSRVAGIPEPATLPLLALGAVWVWIVSRRNRAAEAPSRRRSGRMRSSSVGTRSLR